MSDIAIEFRVKNARLKRAILGAGWLSYAQFAKANQIQYTSLIALLGMRDRATNSAGWRDIAMNIATALHVEPEELWPNEMARVALSTNNGEFAVTLEEAAALTTGRVNREALDMLLTTLNPREARILTHLARGETLDEAAKGEGANGGDISRERVRQMSFKAMRKIQERARHHGIKFRDIVEES